MAVSPQAPRFAKLAELSQQTTSEGRRELLREVTEALSQSARPETDIAAFDQLLTAVASDYATQVRADLAKLIAHNPQFACSAQLFAMDQLEVAEPVLRHSQVLSEETLLKVIASKSQGHLKAVTGRKEISERVSHALVEKGDDEVVFSLLANDKAKIAADTFEMVAQRAQDSALLQKPLVERRDVPIDLLNDLYMRVEKGLRRQILGKFHHLSEAELDQAFRRSRERMSKRIGAIPENLRAANERIEALSRQGELNPLVLIGLLREGKTGRTAFLVAFARLTGVDVDTVQRAIAAHDLDTIALLCRGSNFERALFITLAINLDGQDRGLNAAEEFGKLYEAVPVVAAQRAIRFWKARAAA
ncbi:MAG TPA: DUF2336 domain-containing protein [Rhizomicrobium sp.]|nr:DUF2336 domain-containing protein [Rhizomicrobium sp.]